MPSGGRTPRLQTVVSLTFLPSPAQLCARLFVSGDASQVGKSSVCLGILASLVEQLGYQASEVAYIKPATQCESTQLVAKYCASRGIECVPIGPVLYVSGFTREFLAGNTKSTAEMTAEVEVAVNALCQKRGRKVVVVDGVGFPAVGSIVGMSNAVLARAAHAPVVLVCPRGVGNAVDSFNLNRVFFEHHGVQVLGAIFNRLHTEGFYALEKCKASVDDYFTQFRPEQRVYGYVPEIKSLDGASPPPPALATTPPCAAFSVDWTPEDEGRLAALMQAFKDHVNVKQLFADVERSRSTGDESKKRARDDGQPDEAMAPARARRTAAAALSTDEIRARAVASGAKASG